MIWFSFHIEHEQYWLNFADSRLEGGGSLLISSVASSRASTSGGARGGLEGAQLPLQTFELPLENSETIVNAYVSSPWEGLKMVWAPPRIFFWFRH
jgi:hypothetical protein